MNDTLVKKTTLANPAKVVFAFDLHKVILQPTMLCMVRTIIDHRPLALSMVGIRFWYYMMTEGAVPEPVVDALVSRYSLSKNFLIDLINCQHTNTLVIELIMILKKQGYPVYLASNAWPALWKAVEKKFPQIINLFDGYYVPTAGNGYYEKPSQQYFEGLKQYIKIQEHGDKKILLIDDQLKNIVAAQCCGLLAIRYTSIAECLNELRCMGFLLEKK